MGRLIDGVWSNEPVAKPSADGRFKRPDSSFRSWITPDGSASPDGRSFKAATARYHLYISHACPWAHRTAIFRKLKGLEQTISISAVDPLMLENGWEFGERKDPINGFRHLYEVYLQADPRYSGKVTVPVLYDTVGKTIVSNESSEIIRMLNAGFGSFARNDTDYRPAALRAEIDAVNERVYHDVNNGVYKAGFATSQAAYEEAFDRLFDTLDWLDERLADNRYLVGGQLTEADWRLFTTLIRFDAVYFGHFKCNRRRIADYPNLSGYLRELYQVPGVAETVHIDEIKRHYYGSHESINPTRIVPKGPELDLDAPHDRDRIAPATLRRAG
ncbi:glutathione S-transferase family protein [Oceanibacterium hippocampi]|uniref:Glutathionyl-hydroquinone reductase YqjG n=1 Tax=Oceanibacterium hippocampi TaxID=745714 RepID=A0A1Y5S951_9PROT|nr:glutathione S-transferase family protein [Oceanibacterium hippocampi]SLN34620.1 Glutathionyl-hydroquinone reductase YqjG [Oceanibacterium hippocampi]